jgi:hypothetical protein
MADDVTTTWDHAALAALGVDPHVMAGLLEIGEKIAAEARAGAPRRTGAGADSIHAEPQPGPEPEVRISWERDRFYMTFHERGSVHLPARPFLVPAADRYR